MLSLSSHTLSTLNAPLLLGAMLLLQSALLQASGLCALRGAIHQPHRVLAVAAIIGAATAVAIVLTALLQHLLRAAGLDYLVVFAAVIAAALSVQIAITSLQRTALVQDFPRDAGVALLHVSMLGTAIIVGSSTNGFGEIVRDALLTGAAFTVIYLAFAALSERLELSDVPAPFRGIAIQLIGAGLAALALMGFAGLA